MQVADNSQSIPCLSHFCRAMQMLLCSVQMIFTTKAIFFLLLVHMFALLMYNFSGMCVTGVNFSSYSLTPSETLDESFRPISKYVISGLPEPRTAAPQLP